MWTHGDFVSIHPTTKQLTFHGRADGVLNPSGVRFGSAEIYRVLESDFAQEIADSICVGQRRPTDSDERVILFLLMKPGAQFTAELVQRVRSAIRTELSARHVPMFIFETPEIPVRPLLCFCAFCALPLSGTNNGNEITNKKKSDHCQFEESGAPCEADCFWEANSTIGDSAESRESGILLSIRRG